MHLIWIVLSSVTLIAYLIAATDIVIGRRRIVQLSSVPPLTGTEAPAVSIVIPACNEARTVEAALRSVLNQVYPRLEVIAVNDRSNDGTGEILDRMARENACLRAVHIRELPKRWLGKNHALHTGAQQASGEWVIFADADVVMDPTLVGRAVRYAVERNLDHLAVAPRATVGGFLANVFLAGFAVMFNMHTRPWRVRDPKAKEYIGIGAFNMVRADPYRAAGGHAKISLRPDDDLKLGRLMKLSTGRSDFALAIDLMHVHWYESFAQMREGLMKNFFSAFRYDARLAALAVVSQLVMFAWPPFGALLLHGVPAYLYAAAVVIGWAAFTANAGIVKVRAWWGLALPLAGMITAYLIARAAWMNLSTGGIEWRGTRYSLADLRSNRF